MSRRSVRRGDADKQLAVLQQALAGMGFPEYPPGIVQVRHDQKRVARNMVRAGLLEDAFHGRTPGIGRWYSPRRYAITAAGRAAAREFAGTIPAYGLPSTLLVILACIHEGGGTGMMGCWGSWRPYGWRGVNEKLLVHVRTTKSDAMRVEYFRLADRAGVADLAARCDHARQALVRLNRERTNRGLPMRKLHWRMVPTRLPAVPLAALVGPSCSVCGCTKAKPCRVLLGSDGIDGEATCSPPGLYDNDRCTACWSAA